MHLLQEYMEPQDFQQLQSNLPDSEQAMQQAPQTQPAEGGIAGIAQSVLKAVGVSGGVTGAVTGFLGKTGLNANQVSSFVSVFLDYVRDRAGSGMVDKILQQMPSLQALSPMANAPS